jgi:hypothetical protein
MGVVVMFTHLLPIGPMKRGIASALFMITITSVAVGLAGGSSFVGGVSAAPIEEPGLSIQPGSTSYSYQSSPTFSIHTGNNAYYKVEIALAKQLFNSDYGNRITSSSDENQNFYSSGYQRCDDIAVVEAVGLAATMAADCEATFTLPSSIWRNLRGSRAFYRLITASDMNGSNTQYSTTDANWSNAPYIARTGETWYGLPHNDRAKAGSIDVVLNGRLNGRAMSSDYGPRETSGSKFHPGIDIPVAVGTPVYAIADGTVVRVPSESDSDHRLDINHGNYRSGYVHLSKWLISMNEGVVAGQLIGYSGDWVNGEHKDAHLHFDSGYSGSQIFHNPLEYIRHTDDHTVSTGSGTFLVDSVTHSHAIDIVNAVGDQHKALVAFGITTSYDKDLNYVKVQVDNSTQSGQTFELDYNAVTSQNSSSGVVTLSNGKTFQISRFSDDIYKYENLTYAFYVKPTYTSIDIVATDYFFFPWDITPFENVDNDSPHTIRVTVREVDGGTTTKTITIGPEIKVGDPVISGNQVTYTLTVTNHDIDSGSINLAISNIPTGWSASFSNSKPTISAGGSVNVTLTLTAPGVASMTPLFESKTSVVAAWGRIAALKDSALLCPGEVKITDPKGNDFVDINSTQYVFVEASEGATDVRLEVNGSAQPLQIFEEPTTWIFKWIVPSGVNVQYQLQAFATIGGIQMKSAIVPVISKALTPIGIVWISEPNSSNPNNGEPLNAGETFTIEVGTDPEASQVEIAIDSVRYRMSSSDYQSWRYDWQIPAGVEKDYTLQAYATFEGQVVTSSVVSVNVTIPQGPGEVTFTYPTHGGSITVGDQVTVKVDAPKEAQDVNLAINPADGGSGGWMMRLGENGEASQWEWKTWAPTNINTSYALTAVAHMPDGTQIPSDTISVTLIPKQATILLPSEIKVGDDVTVTVKAASAFSVHLTANGDELTEKSHDDVEWKFTWKPTAGGDYLLYAVVHYSSGDVQYPEKTVTVIDEGQNLITILITSPDPGATVVVGTSTKVTVESPVWLRKVELHITDDTDHSQVLTATYDDFGDYFMTVGLPWTPAKSGVYKLKAYGWSQEGYKGWTENVVQVTAVMPDDPGERIPINEYAFLWKNKQPISGLNLGGYFSDPNYLDTEISASQYVCGVVGIAARGGDIGESAVDDVDIIQAYLTTWNKDKNNSWQVMLYFNTWNDNSILPGMDDIEDRKEHWDVTLLCMDRSVAAYGGPETGKPIFLKQYTGLGDNVGGNGDVSTGIREDEYVCGVAGFASGPGDIEEHDDGDIIRTYLFRKNGEWNIRADFRTHNGAKENWRIDALCISREWASLDEPDSGKPFVYKEYPKLGNNIHYQTEFDVQDWTCGVVGFAARDGDIDEDNKDYDSNLILAYMYESSDKWNIRADFRTHHDDENWDVNVLCMHNDLDAAPELQSARPYLFTTSDSNNVLYGPGMILKWTETYHPQAAYYEIQFSEDGGASWQVYSKTRDISYGGWINHHGSLGCGYGFGHCLKRNQAYSYRVRVLDVDQQPLSSWSNVVAATSLEWPAHVELAEPSPKGPYSDGATVTLGLINTYGKNLRVEWNFQTYTGSTYSVLSGCQNGSPANSDVKSCTIKIRQGSSVASTDEAAKYSTLAPEPHVVVSVMGTDTLGDGYTDHDNVHLYFKDPGGDPDRAFGDVPQSHWAYDYVEYLYDNGYISGCSTDGESNFCPDRSLNRAEMAVLLVRSFHPQEQGYTPDEPSSDKIVFVDLQQMEVDSASSAALSQEQSWCVKWAEELREEGLTSGCSSNPPQYCPFESNSRAQATVFFERVLRGSEYQPAEAQGQIFSDVPLLDGDGNHLWYTKWINQAYQDGLVQACGTDLGGMTFRPDEAITRAEAACMLYYALQGK